MQNDTIRRLAGEERGDYPNPDQMIDPYSDRVGLMIRQRLQRFWAPSPE